MSIIGLNWILVSFWTRRYYIGRARGFMIRASKCFKRVPKLLSQPVWTLIVYVVVLIYSATYLFHITNCQMMEAADDFLSIKFSDSSSPMTSSVVSVFFVLVILWLLLVIKHGQQAIIARAVSQWYFAEVKSELHHPLSHSLLSTLVYSLGSVASCVFCGWVPYEIAATIAHLLRRNKVGDFNAYGSSVKSFTSYFSPTAPVSLGIYGVVKATNICKDPYFDRLFFNNLKMPYFEKRRKSKKSKFVLNALIQDVHISATWCIRSCWIAFTCVSLSAFHTLEDYKQDLGHIKPIPPLITLALTYSICDIWFSVLITVFDALAICLYEDLNKNDGKEKLYYGSRGFIYRVTGARIFLNQTRGGLRFTERKQKEIEKQKAKDEYMKIAEARARNKRRRNMRKKVKPKEKRKRKLSDRVRSFNLVQHEVKLSKLSAKIIHSLAEQVVEKHSCDSYPKVKQFTPALPTDGDKSKSTYKIPEVVVEPDSLDLVAEDVHDEKILSPETNQKSVLRLVKEVKKKKIKNKNKIETIDKPKKALKKSKKKKKARDNDDAEIESYGGFLPDKIPSMPQQTTYFAENARTNTKENPPNSLQFLLSRETTLPQNQTAGPTSEYEKTVWEDAMDFW